MTIFIEALFVTFGMYIVYICRVNVPPGTKVLLKGTVAVEHGILLLNNKNCHLIGGRVEKMAENWELKKVC